MEKPLSLVTGACGFIGSHMVEVLVEAGHRVRATDLAQAFQREDLTLGRFPSVLRGLDDVEMMPADLRAPASLEPVLEGVDFVFHIGALTDPAVPRSILRAVNVEGTRALVEALLEPARKERLRRLVVWGDGGIYGIPEPEVLPLTEASPPSPRDDVRKSKWEQEWLVMEAGRKRGLPWTSLRPTCVYGPRGAGGVGRVLMALAEMKAIVAPSSSLARIPFVHVSDVVRAALHLATDERALGEAFNVTDGSLMSMADVMRAVAEITGTPLAALPAIPEPALCAALRAAVGLGGLISKHATGRPSLLPRDCAMYFGHDFVYSNEKLEQIGFELLYPDTRAGFEETFAWYAEQGWIDQGG